MMKKLYELSSEARFLVWALKGLDWTTSEKLHAKFYSSMTLEAARREMRQAAEESDGQVISGQKGYKLTRRATAEEIDHARKWMHGQARKMAQRVMDITAAAEAIEAERAKRRARNASKKAS